MSYRFAPERRAGLCLLAALVGCGPAPGDPTLPTEESGSTPELQCRPTDVLASSGCLECHGEGGAGGLDLRGPDVRERLVGRPSGVQGCEAHLLVDAAHPDQSQLLRVLRPDDSICQTPMPPGAPPIDDVAFACLQGWVRGTPRPDPGVGFVPTSVDAAVSKVKRIATGLPPTEAELTAVQQDPTLLRSLVDQWLYTEAFERITRDQLRVLLQVEQRPTQWHQIDGTNHAGIRPKLGDALEESVLRTAWDIVDRDAPFTDVFTTRRWAVSTALLVVLRYTDQTAAERQSIDLGHVVYPMDDPRVPATRDEMAAAGIWGAPGMDPDCRDRQGPAMDLPEVLRLQWGHVRCRQMADHKFYDAAPLSIGDDYDDWRFVEFVPADPLDGLDEPPFYDVAAWRSRSGTVSSRLPRAGVFTTPAFLNNWETNPDNQFRVTVHQALITAVGGTFSIAEPTVPLSGAGVDAIHAVPGTDCHGCHRQLDPMRGYFSQSFGWNYQSVPHDMEAFEPSFAHGGVAKRGGDFDTFGATLAAHPRFAEAWVHKLCWIATGEPCHAQDPEVQRIAEEFEQSGFRWRTLVAELLTSPLVTGWDPTTTHRESVPVVVERGRQMCTSLDLRSEDACSKDEVSTAMGLIPSATVTRAEVAVVIPSALDAFSLAGREAVCREMAIVEVGNRNRRYYHGKAEDSIARIATEVAGLPPGHARRAALVNTLRLHHSEARAEGAGSIDALRSAYVLACTSPDAMALGL